MTRIIFKSGYCKEPKCDYWGRLIAGRCQVHYWKSRYKAKFQRRKKTGESELFDKIWNERDHSSELSGLPITSPLPGNFHHVLPKSRYPGQRLDPDNILIVTLAEHDIIHNHSLTEFNDKIFSKLQEKKAELIKNIKEIEPQYTEIL